MLGVLLEYRIKSKMEQMGMFISSVVIEVNEIFNVEMRTDVLYILQRKKKNKCWNKHFEFQVSLNQ